MFKLEGENSELAEKVTKLENEMRDQKEREKKLKDLHADEIKFNAEMNTYEQ